VFTGTVVDGRATVWLTFTVPCQRCILRVTYTPPSTAQYEVVQSNPSGLVAYTRPVTIVSTAPAADHIVAVGATPASIVQPATTTPGNVATAFTVNFRERGLIGRIPVNLTTVTSTISLSLEAQTTQRSWWLVGNGGILRPTLSSNAWQHYQVVGTGVSALTFYFTKTCASCRVLVTYQVPNKAVASFRLPTTFVITTSATKRIVVGSAPSAVQSFKDTAFALWSVGSEASDIAVAGTAPFAAGDLPVPSFAVTTSGNGDGGTLTSASWATNETQVTRVSFTLPCTRCTVSAGGATLPIKVFTNPTFLQPIITPDGSSLEPITSTEIGRENFVDLRALDDAGYVAEMYGATGTDFPGTVAAPLCCAKATAASLSYDGWTPGGFPRSESDFIMADTVAAIPASSGLSIVRGVARLNVTFSQPVRKAYVLFTTADISSRTTSLRPAFPQPRYSISVGTSNLRLRAVSNTDVTRLTSAVQFTVDVALVGSIGSDATRAYVATAADNNVSITFSNCPTVEAPASFFLDSGYARVNITFTAGDVSGRCAISFTAGAGTGRCTTCGAALTSVSIKPLTAASFRFLRPSVFDNGGSPANILYGAAGRQTRVTVQLYGSDAFGVQVPVRSCATCRLEVRMDGSATGQFASCALNVEAPAAFDANGTATVAVLYQDNAQPTYLCNIRVAVYADVLRTTPLLAPDLTSTSVSSVVTVCRPARVAILTNTSAIYRGVLLRTGVAYDLLAVIQDVNGHQCYGDSQDEATRLTVEAVTNEATPLLSRNVVVVNVNDSDATTAGYLNGFKSALSARAEVRAINGAFNFRVVFSNSTVAQGLSGVRIRVTARSATPAISGSSAIAYSSALDTIIAASKLRFAPDADIPSSVVTGRPILTGTTNAYSTKVVVQAVDALNPAWVTLGLLTTAPNVVRGSSAFGSSEEILWKVQPSPASNAFPLTFSTGSQLMRLAAGEAQWTDVKWAGPNGIYTWSVASTSGALTETPAKTVVCQELNRLRIDTAGFTATAPATCQTDCPLPSTVFPLTANETLNNGFPIYLAQSLQSFVITLTLRDSSNVVVVGDSESVIALELISDTRTNLQIGVPPSMVNRGTTYVRAKNGRVVFTMAFLGTTAVATNSHLNASIRFSCPAERPAATLLVGEPVANPCVALQNATTAGFAVVDVRLPTSAHSSAEALAARSVIKFSTAFTSHKQFNQSLFTSVLVPLLAARGFPYINTLNAGKVITLVTCTALKSFNADLGNSVCDGTPRRCSDSAENQNCPSAILTCACPALARSLLLSRFLLQSGSNATITGDKVAVELSFNLAASDAFPARTVAELTAAYRALTAAAMDALKSPALATFVIDAASISSRGLSAPIVTETPVPGTGGTNTTAPSTAAPGTVGVGNSPAASLSTLSIYLLAAALLSLVAV
jgi:hypothetical protein